ncbi:hypothetical protein Tco_0741110 [Tanacetum coccineum]
MIPLGFVQLCLDMQRHKLQQHSRVYSVPSLTMKVFSNMKRITKGFSGQEVALFPNMLAGPTPSASPSNNISSPEHTPSQPSPTQPSPIHPSHTQQSPTQPGSEYHPPTPHDSPSMGYSPYSYNSHGKIGVLEADLTKTKKTYSSAYTKLILRVKKLEAQIKVGKARRHSSEKVSDEVSTAGLKKGPVSEEVPTTINLLKMKPKSIAQARRNMIKYLKNQGNFKITDFKGMSYNDIRPIFEKLWDFNQNIVPMDAEKGSKKQKSPEKEKAKSPEKERSTEKIVEEVGS